MGVDVAKLTSAVFASGRLEILRALMSKPMRYTDLSRRLEISEGELSRQLQRLHEEGFIDKQVTGNFAPTPLARLALRFEPGLSVLAKHAEFFRTHDVHALDEHFLLRIEDLGAADFIDDPLSVFEAITEVRKSVRARLDGLCLIAEHIASGSMSHEALAPLAAQVAQHNTRVRLIVQHEDLDNSIQYQGVLRPEYRTVPLSRMDVFISDTLGLLNFVNREGRMDYGCAFFGSDPRFLQWCRDYFEHVWSSGTPVPAQTVREKRQRFEIATSRVDRSP